MTLFKKITSIAACAVVAVSSMASLAINTSAAEITEAPASISGSYLGISSISPAHQGSARYTLHNPPNADNTLLYNKSKPRFSLICENLGLLLSC